MTTRVDPRRQRLRALELLLAQLEAGRFESALVERALAGSSPVPLLLRACFYAQARRYASARADLERVLERGLATPALEFVAGIIAFSTRDYERALNLLMQAAREPRVAPRAFREAISMAEGLGWEHDVRDAILAALERTPGQPRWEAHAARLYARGRDWERALQHLERALEQAPAQASLWMEAAGIRARLGQRERALEALDHALGSLPDPPAAALPYHVEAARVAIDAGEFERARAQLERAAALEPQQPTHLVALAELASWSGDLASAQAHVGRALELDVDASGALRMRGALQLVRGESSGARGSLERALELDPDDYQAHLWLAQLELDADDDAAAHAHLDAAVARSGEFSLVAELLRLCVNAREHEPETLLPPARTVDFAAGLRELCPDLAERALSSRRVDETLAAVEAALEVIGMNRSVQTTAMLDGGLQRLRTRSGCRYACRRALQLLRVTEGERALAALDEQVAAYPGASLPLSHRGELHLWLGNFEAAKADLDGAIELVRGTRWAYIGLSTLGLLDGDYEGSLAVNRLGVRVMGNTEGPAIYVYRGEALRKLGRLEQAIPELERAVARHPSRASAAFNLALACYAAGQGERADALWLRLRDEQAAGLISDAARELGVEVHLDEDSEARPEVSVEIRVRVLERGLEMMGGNRSSGLLSYWTAEGRLRFCPLWPLRGDGPHTHDRARLDQAKRVLLETFVGGRRR